MNSFTYNNNPQKKDAEEILQFQKKRLAKQQLIFSLLFISILVLLVVYILTRTIYTYYDGYVKLDQNHMRAIDDIYVIDIHKKVGEEVKRGDTLYSYILIQNVLGQYDINSMPTVVHQTNDMKLQADLARQEIPVLQTRISNLQKQLSAEQHDIYYGLTDNTKQNALRAELEQTRKELEKQINRVNIYEHAIGNSRTYMGRRGYGRAGMPFSPDEAGYGRGVLHYCCAPEDAVVTDIKVPERTIVFKTEGIMDLQHTDYRTCNLGVMAYVPSNKVKYMNNDGIVDVIVNDEIELKAHLSIIGMRVEDIPKHLLSNFSHDVDAVVAYFTFLPHQKVPFWVLTNNLPVRIRTNNLKTVNKPFTDREYEIREDNNVVPLPDSISYRIVHEGK